MAHKLCKGHPDGATHPAKGVPTQVVGATNRRMLRRSAATVIASALAVLAAGVPASAAVPSGFETNRELSGLTRATKIAWAPDGRRFVIEKDGLLKAAAPGSTSAQTILDIRTDVNQYSDRGLLGLAVDSDFTNHPYLYLLFTYDVNKGTTTPGPDKSNATVSQLRRITIAPDNQVLASQVILGSYVAGPCPPPSNSVDCIPSEGASHSIGTVLSAPDGTLYVGSGDASNYAIADPMSLRAYDERSMAGKILHIDRNGRGLAGHPFCPGEANLDQVCTKVYAKGLRNPFRFTQLSSGALFVGDVGWEKYEEIDVITAGGKSFGWPCYEGPIRTPTWKDRPECAAEYAKEGTAAAHVGPIHSYVHNYAEHPSWAVIGGPEYTGDTYPDGYRNSIFWGDMGVGFLRRLTVDSTSQGVSIADFGTDWHGVDLTTAPDGDIVWVDLGGWQANAAFVDRLVYSPGNAKPSAVAAANPTSGTSPLTVLFNGSGSSDPDGDVLQYDWDFGDGSPHAAGPTPSHTYASGTYIATLTVSDGRGQSDTDTVQINSSNTPPVPVIDAPAAGFKYRNGVPLTVSGSASDAEQGSLPASAFEWDIRIVHHDHEHLLLNQAGVDALQIEPVRDHDADSYYRIRLTVTDAGGAKVPVEREIRPDTVPLRLRSVPDGAPLSYSGKSVTAPWDTESAIGFTGTITAGESFISGEAEWVFVNWSSAAPRVHDFTVPATETTLTATYARQGSVAPNGPGTGPEGGAEPDVTGPTLRVRRPSRARPRFLTGQSWDAAGVEVVRLAVAKLRGGRCRWLRESPLRLARRSSPCSPRRWVTATLKGSRWRVELPPRLPAGAYRAWFRAVDRLGNVTNETVAGHTQLRFTMGKPAATAACSGPFLRLPLRCGALIATGVLAGYAF